MKWEYKVYGLVPATTKDTESDLNELGQKGWELVTVEPVPGGHYFLIFKRPMNPPFK